MTTSSFLSSRLEGFCCSSLLASSTKGFVTGDKSSTFLPVSLWILSRTFNGSDFSPFTTTL
ncbi:hypothetical protein HanRHA438_Chr12g0543941 [Helianthus annuus]|nr:hypothetical protein HanRHA438_Chr12g0543941 [Helianthus annuus]